jgi:hypothetical protein
MWFQVELPQAAMVTEIQFSSGAPGGRGGRGGAPPAAAGGRASGPPPPPPFGSFPIAYKVQVSMDGTTWSAPVGQGQGSPATTVVSFTPVRAKFIRVTQTGSGDNAPPWSILNFRVYATGGKS